MTGQQGLPRLEVLSFEFAGYLSTHVATVQGTDLTSQFCTYLKLRSRAIKAGLYRQGDNQLKGLWAT